MNEKLASFLMQIIQEALEKKHGQVNFVIADGKIVDIQCSQKLNRQDLVDAQKN